jgi:hypothetical protein
MLESDIVRITPSHGFEYFNSGLVIRKTDKPRKLEFSVSAKNDVHIGLLPVDNGGQAFEIVIGGWQNTLSAIRKMPSEYLFPGNRPVGVDWTVLTEPTEDVLAENRFVTIKVEISSHKLLVSVDGSICLECLVDVAPVDLGVYYRSGFGCAADWQFQNWPKRAISTFNEAPSLPSSEGLLQEEIQVKFRELVLSLKEKFSMKMLSMTEADIAALRGAGSLAIVDTKRAFDQMVEQAEMRRSCLLQFRGIKVISLGADCFPRTIATHWGLKPSARLGERSHPFDLAVYTLSAVAKFIESDFLDYLSLPNLMISETGVTVRDVKYGIHFNHEVGEIFIKDNYSQLITTYRRRIDNFYADMQDERKKLFFCHNPILGPGDVANLENIRRALFLKWEKKNILFVCVNTWPFATNIPHLTYSMDPRCLVIDINLPKENYIWHLPTDRLSVEGYTFEKEIVLKIQAFLSSNV